MWRVGVRCGVFGAVRGAFGCVGGVSGCVVVRSGVFGVVRVRSGFLALHVGGHGRLRLASDRNLIDFLKEVIKNH